MNPNTRNYKHGLVINQVKHPLYIVWNSMMKRCENSNDVNYNRYGGRGINVCKSWADNAGTFSEWALNNGWIKGLHLDRIDNDKGYCPENCRFVTCKENQKNKPLINTRNTSGYRGAYWHKINQRWVSHIVVDGKCHGLGTFFNKIDAAVARDSYVISKGLGLPLNFPQPITEIK